MANTRTTRSTFAYTPTDITKVLSWHRWHIEVGQDIKPEQFIVFLGLTDFDFKRMEKLLYDYMNTQDPSDLISSMETKRMARTFMNDHPEFCDGSFKNGRAPHWFVVDRIRVLHELVMATTNLFDNSSDSIKHDRDEDDDGVGDSRCTKRRHIDGTAESEVKEDEEEEDEEEEDGDGDVGSILPDSEYEAGLEAAEAEMANDLLQNEIELQQEERERQITRLHQAQTRLARDQANFRQQTENFRRQIDDLREREERQQQREMLQQTATLALDLADANSHLQIPTVQTTVVSTTPMLDLTYCSCVVKLLDAAGAETASTFFSMSECLSVAFTATGRPRTAATEVDFDLGVFKTLIAAQPVVFRETRDSIYFYVASFGDRKFFLRTDAEWRFALQGLRATRVGTFYIERKAAASAA